MFSGILFSKSFIQVLKHLRKWRGNADKKFPDDIVSVKVPWAHVCVEDSKQGSYMYRIQWMIKKAPAVHSKCTREPTCLPDEPTNATLLIYRA